MRKRKTNIQVKLVTSLSFPSAILTNTKDNKPTKKAEKTLMVIIPMTRVMISGIQVDFSEKLVGRKSTINFTPK